MKFAEPSPKAMRSALVLPRPRSSVLGTSSQSSFSPSSSANSAMAAAAALDALCNPDADSSSWMRTLTIFRGAGMTVNWSGSDVVSTTWDDHPGWAAYLV